jgi:hypothetical protein
MQIEINTKEDLIQFIESHELTTNQVNELLRAAAIGCLFIHDHNPTERARILRNMFAASKIERPIFLDIGDIGAIEND